MATTIIMQDMTDEQKTRFVSGWEAAGGYTDDCVDGNPSPLCCPWYYAAEITIEGDTPEAWGKSWWGQCKGEVDTMLAEEELLERERPEEDVSTL